MNEEPEFAIGIPGLEAERRCFPWNLLVFHLLAALAGFVGPLFYLPHRRLGSLTACKSNCKNIATALEMYASDNGGKYPHDLRLITRGNYLKLIPTCPAAGEATYFSFTRFGNNHARHDQSFTTSRNNYPQYHGEYGLLDHP